MLDFHGYADEKATQKKIVENVRKKGDIAFKSGMYKDLREIALSLSNVIK